MNPVRYFTRRRFWIAAVCALALAGCGDHSKSDAAAAMNEVFTRFASQHYKEVYDDASPLFQMRFGERAFEAMARDLHLGSFASCRWSTVSVTGREAVLNGEMINKSNQKFLITGKMLKESGRWRLLSIGSPAPGNPSASVDLFERNWLGYQFDSAFSRELPNENEVKILTDKTMLKFGEAIQKKDFHDFYSTLSLAAQSQTSPEQLAHVFKRYIDTSESMDFVKFVKLVLDEPPRYDSHGYLLVKGYYPTQPDHVYVQFQYGYNLYDSPEWKLMDVAISEGP